MLAPIEEDTGSTSASRSRRAWDSEDAILALYLREIGANPLIGVSRKSRATIGSADPANLKRVDLGTLEPDLRPRSRQSLMIVWGERTPWDWPAP